MTQANAVQPSIIPVEAQPQPAIDTVDSEKPTFFLTPEVLAWRNAYPMLPNFATWLSKATGDWSTKYSAEEVVDIYSAYCRLQTIKSIAYNRAMDRRYCKDIELWLQSLPDVRIQKAVTVPSRKVLSYYLQQHGDTKPNMTAIPAS